MAPYCVTIIKHDVVSTRAVRQRVRYSDSLRPGSFGDQIPVGARFSVPVHTGIEAYPAFCAIGTGFSPGVKRPGRGASLGFQWVGTISPPTLCDCKGM